MIDGEEKSLKIGNLIDCADKSISDNASVELIATTINAGDQKYFSDNAAGGLIDAINAVD